MARSANIALVIAARSYTLRFHVLPWVLGALLLRAMIPMGFMPAEGTALAVAMCSTQGVAEEIEIPGVTLEMQCDYCLTSALAAAPAISTAPAIAPRVAPPGRAFENPHSRFALVRAQTPRAPPA
jgi:hypothetical protein